MKELVENKEINVIILKENSNLKARVNLDTNTKQKELKENYNTTNKIELLERLREG